MVKILPVLLCAIAGSQARPADIQLSSSLYSIDKPLYISVRVHEAITGVREAFTRFGVDETEEMAKSQANSNEGDQVLGNVPWFWYVDGNYNFREGNAHWWCAIPAGQSGTCHTGKGKPM